MRKKTKWFLIALSALVIAGIAAGTISFWPKAAFVPEEVDLSRHFYASMMNIIEDGQSDYVIVRGAQASPTEITAAEKLQAYLLRVSGCKLEIVADDTPAGEKEIAVGETNRGGQWYWENRDELGDDGFIIEARGDGKIYIAGGKRGVIYGVFDFLERYLGCLWLTPETTIIPEMRTVAVPEEIDVLGIPAFAYRSPQIDFASCTPETEGSVDYCLANRINGHMATAVAEEKYGGLLDYQIGGAYFITMDEALYAEHPDWFALNEEGERVFGEYGSPCMSNEGLIQYYIDYALGLVAENPEIECIGMGLNDTALSCQCETCKAIYAEEGTIGKVGESGGTQARLFNRVSAALDEVGSPAKLGTHAYAANAEAPQKTKYPDRAVLYFAPIGSCYAHPFATCTYKGTVNHRRQLEDWVKAASNFIQFDYPCNYDHWNAPYPLWAALQPNIQYFYENSFIGLFNCGGAEHDTSFFPMTAWLYGKLLWDPARDMEALYREFLPAYYGEGWQYLREYVRITSEELTGQKFLGRATHFDRTDSPGKRGLLSMRGGEVKYVDALWEHAKALAKEEWQLTNVRRAEISYRIWKADTFRGEFSLFAKRTRNNRQLLADLWALGLTQHGFDHLYVTPEESERLGVYRLTPRYWTWRMLGYTTKEKAESFPQMVWGWLFW